MRKRIGVAFLALVLLFALGEVVTALTLRRASDAVEHSIRSHHMLPGQEEAVASMTAALADMRRARALLIWVPASGALFALGVVWWLSAGFAAPVAQLVRAARAVGGGDLEYQVKIRGTDEFAEVAASFNEMTCRLLEAQARLRQAARLTAVGEVATGVAHNFGNILTIVRGYADTLVLLGSEDPLPPMVEESAGIIREQAERGTAIVQRLNRFARGGANEVGETSLADVTQSALTVARAHPLAKRAQWVTALPDDLPLVRGNAGELEEVVVNLLINALQAMPGGGSIRVSAGRAPAPSDGASPGAWLSVADTGCGIPPENLGRVFEPFFTKRLPDQEPGTGLGLSSSLAMLRRMGGDMAVESTVGKGTTFTLSLPVWQGKGDPAPCA